MGDNNPDVSTNAAPPEQTQNVATPDQLQAPAAPAPAQQPMQLAPAQPSATAPPVAPSPNQRLHSFVSSVLGGISSSLAGKPATKYTTDAAGRTVADPNQPKDSMGDQWRRIGAAALTGLGAGAQAGGQKSGLANALAGAGAGAEAQINKSQTQDKKAREDEKQNAEAAEQKIVRMHQTARENALTYSTWKHMIDEDVDRNPEYKNNSDIVAAAKDSDMGIKYVSESELHAMDPKFIAEHRALPVGQEMLKGPDGNPLMDEEGKPKMEARFALIDGFHDGNVTVPASFVSDLKKYGKWADGGGTSGEDSLKAGDEMSADHFKMLRTAVLEGKKRELEGWAKPELAWQGDTPVRVNPNTAEVKPYSSDPKVIPNALNKPENAEVKDALTKAQTEKAQADTMLAITNAHLLAQGLLGNGGGDANMLQRYADAIKDIKDPVAQSLLRGVPPALQEAVLSVAAGDQSSEAATKSPRKGVPAMTPLQMGNLAKLINNKWTENTFKAKGKLLVDLTSGKDSLLVDSLNQFLGHAGQAIDIVNKFKSTNSPYANKSINWLRANALGDPQVFALMQSLEPVRAEYLNMIKSGKAATAEEISDSHKAMHEDMPMVALAGNLSIMGEQNLTRMDQINEKWRQENLGDAPNLLRSTGLEGAKKLGIGKQASKYNTGGNYVGAPNGASSVQNTPSTNQPVQMDKLAPNVLKDISKIHSDGKVTIGWDPTQKTWVDAYTGKLYQQTAPAQGAQ